MTARAVYIGPGERRAFAWLHEPTTAPSGIGVVVCAPFGYEAILAHRALRLLAERLAARGHTVLRFDYYGTGNSDGMDDAPHLLERWIANIADAQALLRAEGCTKTARYGLRLGALVAAVAGGDELLVAHAPIASGKSYVRELRAFRRLAAASDLDDDSTAKLDPNAQEAAGFVLWGETAAAISTIDFASLSKAPARDALVLGREDLAGHAAIAAMLEKLGVVVSVAEPRDYVGMMLDPHNAVVPHASIAAIGDWLEPHRCAPAPRTPMIHAEVLAGIAAPRITLDRVTTVPSPTVHERPIRFGDGDRLFGIWTESEAPPTTSEAILLLNSGAVHNVGSNRMHVLWARAWAAKGRRVLRFDIGGLGESAPAVGVASNLVYSHTAVQDVAAAVAEAQRRGAEHVALVGLCAGAYAAFHTARTTPVASVVLINPQTFDYKDGDPLDIEAALNVSEAVHYRHSMMSPEKWRKLLSGNVNVAHVAHVVATRVWSRVQTRLVNLRRQFSNDDEAEGPLGRELRMLAARTKVGFVYSVDDPGLDHLDREAGEAIRRLRAEHLIDFNLIERADHTFTPPRTQRRLFAVVSRLLGIA